MGQKMRAVVIRRYGSPDVLETLEVEKPVPAPGGVLIRAIAAGINPADCPIRSGGLRFAVRQKMPFVPGADMTGVVEATGPDARRFRVGDAVFAMLSQAPPAVVTQSTPSPRSGTSRPYRQDSRSRGRRAARCADGPQALRDGANLAAGDRRSETRRARGKLVLVVDEKLAAGRVESTPIQANPSVG